MSSHIRRFNVVNYILFGDCEHARTPKELSCRMELGSQNLWIATAVSPDYVS
jgi:hypothetical protein